MIMAKITSGEKTTERERESARKKKRNVNIIFLGDWYTGKSVANEDTQVNVMRG